MSDPLDMNKVMAETVARQIQQTMPVMLANSLLAAGNALRGQAFGMMSTIQPGEFLAQPAKLSDGGCMVLLSSIKYIGNTFRLFVTPFRDKEGVVLGRTKLVVDEVEMNTIQSKFVQLNPELEAELDRQIAAISLPDDGTIELCLAIIPAEIEGFHYFQPDTEAEVMPDAAASLSNGVMPEETPAVPVSDSQTPAPQSQAEPV